MAAELGRPKRRVNTLVSSGLGSLKSIGLISSNRLLPQAIQKLGLVFGRDVVVEIVVYLDGGGPGTGADALHFLNREFAVGGDFLVANAQLLAGVFVEFVAR